MLMRVRNISLSKSQDNGLEALLNYITDGTDITKVAAGSWFERFETDGCYVTCRARCQRERGVRLRLRGVII